MTREQLEARKAEAAAQRDQALAAANIAQGVVVDCDYWLAQLEAEAKAAAPQEEGKQ